MLEDHIQDPTDVEEIQLQHPGETHDASAVPSELSRSLTPSGLIMPNYVKTWLYYNSNRSYERLKRRGWCSRKNVSTKTAALSKSSILVVTPVAAPVSTNLALTRLWMIFVRIKPYRRVLHNI